MNSSIKIILPLIIGLLISSCALERSSVTAWSDKDSGKRDGSSYLKEERKILLSASMSMTVESPDTTHEQIRSVAAKYDGYVSESSSRHATIRVLSKHFDTAIDELSTFGDVQSKKLRGADVTDQYIDFEIRLENAIRARDRYLILLDRANNIAEAIKVEKELERLNGTIDMLKGKLERYDHLEQYSSISVYFKEKKKPGLLGYVGMGIYYPIKWLFVRN
ncbi:DUF4349 domain-containing protein [Crocinitomix catalasitica]|nr:DUF4349 domain-containing protein [Crocinitomix catalasitica]MBN4077648.1 DUF4349 domain-containing protein [bacterium AH-315-C20]